MKKHLYFLLISLPLWCLAQDPIECDRPDQTETPSLVPDKNFQMETGVYYIKEDDKHQLVYPACLIKYGMNNVAELRVELEGATFIENPESAESSNYIWSPVALGLKLKICEEQKTRPKISVITMLSLPALGVKDFNKDYPTSEIRFLFQHSLPKGFSISYNLGGYWDGSSSLGYALYTVSGGYSITPQLGCYVELYGDLSLEQSNNADAGFTYVIGKNYMLDVSAGVSIDKQKPSWFAGLGFSFRLPN